MPVAFVTLIAALSTGGYLYLADTGPGPIPGDSSMAAPPTASPATDTLPVSPTLAASSPGDAASAQTTAKPAAAATSPLDYVLGDPEAPVTIIEYSSLTCGHCGNFHRETLPQIKKDYIDAGKVNLIFRDFPIGQLALVASLVPHCAGGERYYGVLDLLFQTQLSWATSGDPLAALQQTAKQAGMSDEAFETCLQSQELARALLERANEGQQIFAIEGTPTFVIDGEPLVGHAPYAEFRRRIEAALDRKG